LEVRRAWDPNHNYAFAATALASKISLVTKTRMANGCSENASIIPPRYFAPRRWTSQKSRLQAASRSSPISAVCSRNGSMCRRGPTVRPAQAPRDLTRPVK